MESDGLVGRRWSEKFEVIAGDDEEEREEEEERKKRDGVWDVVEANYKWRGG